MGVESGLPMRIKGNELLSRAGILRLEAIAIDRPILSTDEERIRMKDDIVRLTASEFGLFEDEIRRKSKSPEYYEGKLATIEVARTLTILSSDEMGELIGKTGGSVTHLLKASKRLLSNDIFYLSSVLSVVRKVMAERSLDNNVQEEVA
jgi:chromosomal replication initiation ATPase DnaA